MLFTYLGAVISIVSYCICFGLLNIGIKLLNKLFPRFSDFKTEIILAFLLLSLIGLVICFDNVNNFNEPFGSGHDDSDYFNTIAQLAGGQTADVEAFLFEYPMALYGFFINVLLPFRYFTLYDLLPVNWAIAALCVGLSGYLASLVVGKRIPRGLLLIALVGNYIFVHNTVQLFRECFIMFFALSAIISILQDQKVKAFIFFILTSLLRGANGILTVFFLGLQFLTHKLRNKYIYLCYILIVLFIVLFTARNMNQYGGLLRAISTSQSKFSNYYSSFEGMSSTEIIQKRYENKFSGERGIIASYAYSTGGLAGNLSRVIYSLFYPIRYYSPNMNMEHSSVNKLIYINNGFFIYNIIRWVMVSSWIIIIPLLVLGFYFGLRGNSSQKNILILYIVSLLAFTFISGHPRHNLFFHILNPVFVNIAFHRIIQKTQLRTVNHTFQMGVAFLLISYNIFT